MGRSRVWAWVAGIVILAGTVWYSGSADVTARQEATPATQATPPAAIGRDVLTSGMPPGAPGQALQLARYTIPAGAVLAVHVHPGMQTAWIESGELTYHVIKGEAPIGRGASAATPGPTETLGAGETTILEPGDWVVEAPGVVHYGENLTSEPVIILAATLFEVGEPSAIPVDAEGTPVG